MANDHESKVCRRCGRKLKSLKSRELGMGEVCYKKWCEERKNKKLISLQLEVSKL